MRDNRDPELMGKAIYEIMQSEGCSILRAADSLNHLIIDAWQEPHPGTGGDPAVASGLLSSAALDGHGPSAGLAS